LIELKHEGIIHMKRFKNILYHADGDTVENPALKRAVALAQTNQAALTVMDVISEKEIDAEVEKSLHVDLSKLLEQRRREELEALIQPYQKTGLTIAIKVASGTPFIELIRAVEQDGHDLIMKAIHPLEGLTQRLFGSFDMHLLRKCPCPVWIDRPESAHPYRNILAAVATSEQSSLKMNRLIMDLASSLAERESAHLHVIQAWRLPGEKMLRSGRARIPPHEIERLISSAEDNHRHRLQDLLADYGLTPWSPRVRFIKDKAAKAITTYAAEIEADLIVMGTVGRSGIPGLIFGNTAEDVLHSTQASVLAVKPEGFVSPVPLS
jgi:nucleotide-binding universal stress UspA family protein